MEDITKKKIVAGAKVALGAARMAGAVATGTGHGLIGAALRQHHMMHAAGRLAKLSWDGGWAQFKAGIEEWKRAQ